MDMNTQDMLNEQDRATEEQGTRVPRAERYYIRCTHCLSIGSIDLRPQKDWTCSICAGPVESMGRVSEDQRWLETEKERVPCDARCTNAQGPLCTCKCHCANHGTKRLVTIIVREGIPAITFDDDEALARATSYREELTRAEEILALLVATKRERYLSQAEFERYRLAFKMIPKAKEARTFKARMKHLAQVI